MGLSENHVNVRCGRSMLAASSTSLRLRSIKKTAQASASVYCIRREAKPSHISSTECCCVTKLVSSYRCERLRFFSSTASVFSLTLAARFSTRSCSRSAMALKSEAIASNSLAPFRCSRVSSLPSRMDDRPVRTYSVGRITQLVRKYMIPKRLPRASTIKSDCTPV